MISIIVTAFQAPEITKKCINRLLNQENFNETFEIIAACPDEPTKEVILNYKKKYPKIIKYIHQEYDCSKNQLINNILKISKGRILIWTDGNKVFEKNTIQLLIEPFKDEKVGIVGGRIILANKQENIYGNWNSLLTQSLHDMRKNRFKKRQFIEHTANILAMRNDIIKKIPLDVAEGSIISFLISNKNYKSIYEENAKVYVNYPDDLSKHFYQRARSSKAHMELFKYTKKSHIKYKNFYNEVLFFAIKNTFKNFLINLSFVFFLLFVQLRAFFSLRIRKQHYVAVWKPKPK